MNADPHRVPTGLISEPPDAVSCAWVRSLTSAGPEREDSTRRLHALLLRAARRETLRRTGLGGVAGRELEDLAHQAADDAAMSILRRVPEFRGESRFTTWAYAFVIYEVSSKLARHTWRREIIQLDDAAWDRLPGRLGLDPEDMIECRELVLAVHEAVEQTLTPHQRDVFSALVLRATPLDVVVLELGSNRNAVYKTMFDVRAKLRAYLVSRGHLAQRTGGPS